MQTIIHTDVVILGGGSAGVAAAAAAAETGLKVTLIERNAFLGGKATAAEVGTVCGLYKFSKKEEPEYIANGFVKQFAEALKRGSHTEALHNNTGLHYLPYNIEVFKKNCEVLLRERGVKVYLGSTLHTISISEGSIESITVSTGDSTLQLHLKSVIDCSGDSVISQFANLPLIKSDNYQAAAQVFTLKGVTETSEVRLGMVLMKVLRQAIVDKKLDHYFDRVYIVQGSLKNNTVSIKIGIPLPVTHTPENLLELKITAHAFVKTLTDFLVKNVPSFHEASLQHIAPEIGVRVGVRTAGKYILTEDDVLSCRKFDDAIANASWPIEEWEQNRRVKMRYFQTDDYYQVPAGCLQSETVGNLFTAGRNISATDSAIASARVMGICLQTGYAAGKLAAAKALSLPAGKAVQQIQEELFR
jgi:hypothetical protein